MATPRPDRQPCSTSLRSIPAPHSPARVVLTVANSGTGADRGEVAVDLAGFGAITLAGPHARDLAHAAIVALLATRDLTATTIVLAGSDLLPGVPDFPGLHRADHLPSALDELEARSLHRTRLLELEALDDFATYRHEYPDDPLPAIVLVATSIAPADTGRLAAVLGQGRRLGIGALLPGVALPDAARIALDDTGRIATARPAGLSRGQLVGAGACRLTAQEATDLLTTIAQSRSDELDSERLALHPAAGPNRPNSPGRRQRPGQPSRQRRHLLGRRHHHHRASLTRKQRQQPRPSRQPRRSA